MRAQIELAAEQDMTDLLLLECEWIVAVEAARLALEALDREVENL